jgi:cell division protein FtsQ
MKRPEVPRPVNPEFTATPKRSPTRETPRPAKINARTHRQESVRVRHEATLARQAVRDARRARKEFEKNEVRRFTARVRRRRQAWLAGVLSVVALATFVIVGVFSPVMRVEEITITGATRVDATSISVQLDDQIGVPLPLVDVARIEEVLRRQNLVESYSIESRPPHDLIIHLVERQPIAYMPAGTAFMLADAAGVTIETAPAYPGGFPLLHVPRDEPKGVAFESAVNVIRSLPGSIRDRISEVTASTSDDVSFVLGDTGQRVFWGSADDAATKTRGLLGLLANWPPGTANEYDVSSKDNVVVR